MRQAMVEARHLLALLRAQAANYQDAHWEVGGPQFYGDHLLFERLYTSVQGEIDTLAEKMVGTFGPTSVEVSGLAQETALWISRWSGGEENLHRRAWKTEQDFEKFLPMVHQTFQAEGSLSLGWDDLLASMANAHEGHRYLLSQRLRSE